MSKEVLLSAEQGKNINTFRYVSERGIEQYSIFLIKPYYEGDSTPKRKLLYPTNVKFSIRSTLGTEVGAIEGQLRKTIMSFGKTEFFDQWLKTGKKG